MTHVHHRLYDFLRPHLALLFKLSETGSPISAEFLERMCGPQDTRDYGRPEPTLEVGVCVCLCYVSHAHAHAHAHTHH